MSTFACKARRIQIEPHPNADAIELARVDDYVSIVRKGEFEGGDVAIYIPEQAIVPEPILLDLGLYRRNEDGTPLRYENGTLAGGLAGSAGNRVKAVRLRGIVSQGLLYRPEGIELEEGMDYAETLGIRKWVPEIPTDMQGEPIPCPSIRSYTEIESIQAHPGVFAEDEPVAMTEKIHGTCSIFHLDVESGELAVSSKGFAKRGVGFGDERLDSGESRNLYWRVAHRFELGAKLAALAEALGDGARVVTLYGETYGVQDLRYGHSTGEPGFAAFDLAIDGKYVDHDRFVELTDAVSLPRVPLIYAGPFSSQTVWEAAQGKEQVTGREVNIREGVVVRPVKERHDPALGRVVLRALSDDYLLRKNKDATEFE